MTDNWWTEPYNGGPMVAVPGFPRKLYPPDAARHGKQPSTDGPDVVAYKRTVWRAGRWPGPASSFDDSYSNGFAHGTSGNVSETGVAGVQRQGAPKLDDTGWIGEKTFNLLRSIRVPEGPHEGEMAMDANAANLIAEAHARFHPPPPPKSTTRERALDGAEKYLGYTESPANSNRTTFGQWYGVDGQPWCAIFVTYVFETEAGGSPSFARYADGNRYAYVPYIVDDARNGRHGLKATGDPIPGDVVCYDWQGDGIFDHVGIFDKWSSGRAFFAIEGNTSYGDDSNGGEVMRRERDAGSGAVVFVRVSEP